MKKKIIAIIIAVALLTVGLSAIPIMADAANGQMTHVKLTPENVALVTGTTQQFTVQALDNNNQPVANVIYFWVVAEGGGSIDTNGLFTAGTTDATVEVIAVQGKIIKPATAKVTVEATLGTLDHILVTPATANVAPSGKQQFTAQGYDSKKVAIPNLNYVWAVTGAGTVSGSGLFTAGTTTGTATVTATVGSSGIIGTATVNVTTNPTPTTTPTPTGDHYKISLFSMFQRYLKNIGSDNFLGGQWQVKNSSGGIDTYNLISGVVQGVVQNASGTTLAILPNGGTSKDYTLTTSTIVQPKGTTFAKDDKVIVLTVNNDVVMVSKIAAVSTTQLPPGLRNKGNEDNQKGKDTPPGWSQGKKTGWNLNPFNGKTRPHSNGN